MTLRERILESEINQERRDKDSFRRALYRTGAIILSGYLIGTVIALYILR